MIWALAIWRILVAAVQYAFLNIDYFSGQEFTTFHEIGLLVVAIIGVVLWTLTSQEHRERIQLHLHSTQLVSGAMFVLLGLLFLNGSLATFNTLVPPDLAIWFAGLEDRIIELFN
jgi:hypothetical protein